MADIALLGGFVASVEHDNDHSAAADEVEPVAWTIVNPHLGQFSFDRLPISEAARFSLSETRCDADLCTPVFQAVKPRDECFSLANGKHGTNVAIWIQVVKRDCVWYSQTCPNFHRCLVRQQGAGQLANWLKLMRTHYRKATMAVLDQVDPRP